MSEVKALGLKFVKSVGKAGFIGYRVYADDEELANKLFSRLEDYEREEAIELSDKVVFRGKPVDPEAFTWLYAMDKWIMHNVDITPEDLNELIEKLRAEYEKITEPHEVEVILKPKHQQEGGMVKPYPDEAPIIGVIDENGNFHKRGEW